MVTAVALRTKLQNKIFTPFGTSVTFINKLSPTYNIRGEEESYLASTSLVQIVPYNVFTKSQTYESFGTINPGEMDAAVPYDTTVNIGTLFVLNNIGWEVKALQPNYLPGDQNVVTILRLARTQA